MPHGRYGVVSALAATLLVAVALVAAAAPAYADPGFVPSPDSGATVTRLNLVSGHGAIGLTISVGAFDQIVGAVVTLPAAAGTWQASPTVIGPGGLTCSGRGGAGLTYSCLTPPDPQDSLLYLHLPVGQYALSLPVTRLTGPIRGYNGGVGVTRPVPFSDSDSTTASDTFPVLSPSTDPQSSAEVRGLTMGYTFQPEVYYGTFTIRVQVQAGDAITGVFVSLPTTPTIAEFFVDDVTESGGIMCGKDLHYPPPAATFVVACLGQHSGVLWPAGSYSLRIKVIALGGGDTTALVRIRQQSGAFLPYDSFPAATSDSIAAA